MANYMGSARSNYFRVRNETAFFGWVETVPGAVARREDGEPERFALFVEDADGDGWPNWRYDEITGDEEELDLYYELRVTWQRVRWRSCRRSGPRSSATS